MNATVQTMHKSPVCADLEDLEIPSDLLFEAIAFGNSSVLAL